MSTKPMTTSVPTPKNSNMCSSSTHATLTHWTKFGLENRKRHDGAPLRYRFYVELQAVHSYHAHGFAFGHGLRRYGAPQFAVNADHAFDAVRQRSDHDSLRIDHFFAASCRFPGAGAQNKAHQENG